KKISQEYLKLLNNGKDLKFSFFIKEYEFYISDEYKGLFTEDKKHTLVINDEFNTFFDKKVVVNHKSQSLFLMFLNTLDIKYLHIKPLKRVNMKSFCFILDNLKKKMDEIVFIWCYISDEVIRSLNANLNFKDLKKMVFIESEFVTSFIFTEHLSKIEEFIFCEKHSYKSYTVPEFEAEDLNIAEFITKSLKDKQPQTSIDDFIKKNNYILKKNKDFYLKLLNENNFSDKVRIIEYFECENYNLEVKCFFQYKGCFKNIYITFKKLNDKRFIITENTILEENIKSIKISCSEIKSDFLNDILNIKGLKRLEIDNSNIYIENEIYRNESIKYFKFWTNDNDCYSIFFKLIKSMIGLQEIYFHNINTIKLNCSVDQSFYIQELSIRDINEMIDLLQNLAMNEKFDFEATSKAKADLKLSRSPLNFLFQNEDISSIKKLSISDFSIDNSDVKAFSTLLRLKEINIVRIKFQNISFSELFCANQEYKIEKMKLSRINISEKDYIFIANLKNIRVIIFSMCNILKMTYGCYKFLFNNEGYIEQEYMDEEENLAAETIKFIKEKFTKKYLL
ncbi:hypothetical protein CWI36_2334p0010, partial [Hamiltosporidium magnivora]